MIMNDHLPSGQDRPTQDRGTPLKRGWTTGACATAATKAALNALFSGKFPDPVQISLPGGQTPFFALAQEKLGGGFAQAGIIKDAGDDPDVTHGATIISRVKKGAPGSGIVFCAGKGVGTVTKPGLSLDVGQPAINPVPRQMITEIIKNLCARNNMAPDIEVEISVPQGEKIAKKTWNPRLGIIGGISILGTSGIVIPYSCSAWIHSIHSGIDVARALGLGHIVAATGDLSEKAARHFFSLPQEAYIDMGDFVGGLLKYLRKNPVSHLTIAGGFGKISKLANAAMDLHSKRSQIDLEFLAGLLARLGANQELVTTCRKVNSANQALELAQKAGFNLAQEVGIEAATKARAILKNDNIELDILVIDRKGTIVGHSGEKI
ncbi:Proposed precorrin-5* (C1)-methyltransferase @ Cobalt-precorrin-5B (C1)-methyltransferase [hydrothermal vent metagenome]|uniref:Proposed precorrin-5* (C1)-methyltransferase @ Cobalt-precorrin-5B (C1)-methyltransferase n=1 Tax=hydrothermal vent metagenome TaxID=652676 RepID=A0A3B0TIR0_9ZZZZ